MAKNILVTGGGGYIGGSVWTELNSRAGSNNLLDAARIIGVIRSQSQAEQLSKVGLNGIFLNLTSEADVKEVILKNKIDIVVHTASSMDPGLIVPLIKALGERRKASGEDVHIIQSSVSNLYAAEGGWPFGEIRDDGPVLEKEKQMGGNHPVLATNIILAETAKQHGVTFYNVAVPCVYGRGTGQFRKLSMVIPSHIRAGIQNKRVHKYDKDGVPAAAHITDLASLYALIVEKILQGEDIPRNESGYYFAEAHKFPWWDVLGRLALSMHAQGLVTDPEAKIWPNDEFAAECLQNPLAWARIMGTATGLHIPVNAYKIGWKPKWSLERLLENMDDEVQALLETKEVRGKTYEFLEK